MDEENGVGTRQFRIDFVEETEDTFPVSKPRKSLGVSNSTFRPLRLGSVLHTWTDLSRINYIPALTFSDLRRESRVLSTSVFPKNFTNIDFDKITINSKDNDSTISETFFVNATSLLNEDNLWGCFYNFPGLYEDAYSPVVRIRKIEDVPELERGVLTGDMVTACLSYLKRTPILGDFVYIKLDLSSKYLTNIDVLQHYKYIVYLDLSSNLISDLNVLSKLPYLQYFSVNYNRLRTVLDYETPQWFLTEVHYRYNSVLTIRDLSALWSITVLDLAHNNIKEISGLQNLRYLRHLDLSFNHIQRLENLNHLRLLWLDVSYNNLSSFEFGPDAGLWTLLHLEYLNLNENNLMSMKIFSGCTRIRELHAKNNRFSMLLELAVYMRKLRRLMLVDLRSNPVCNVPGYKDVVINTFPTLLNLDARDLDPVEKRSSMMYMSPDVSVFASRRLLRLLYIQQLTRSRVSPYVPPADTTDVPIIVLVGNEAVGKGSLARRLAEECSNKIELALQHTTAGYHYANHYKVITRRNFDGMLLAGDFLTYSEMDGESYGLSREEAFVKDGKVKLVTMDLLGALMLKLRGYRPFLILAHYLDKRNLALRQHERKEARNLAHEKRLSQVSSRELSALQVLLSGRIIINGILNEILQNSSLVEDKADLNKSKNIDSGLRSLYREPQGIDEYVSDVCGLDFNQERNQSKKPSTDRSLPNKQDPTNAPVQKSIDCNKSFTWKGFGAADSRKSSKSVTFTSPENTVFIDQVPSTSGMMVEPRIDREMENLLMKSISEKVAWPHADAKPQDSDLWLAFLIENGLFVNSDTTEHCDQDRRPTNTDDPNFIVNQLDHYKEIPSESFTTHIKDTYEEIHRNTPGLFWDTITMDNPEAAFKKMKTVIKNIVNSQPDLKPMIDIDLTNMKNCSIVKKKLANIHSQIAPQRLFY
ncbi:uncharacterized protein LOC123873628 isoform X2 [Maniola jurtina]|uniref:uncharacterized protein LOC123873628 isoform X2 n=1 Tax=Maniola jurtina TaxID=191418 RepID=UPI001E68C8E2|nr:uncharacterized protein LOC123873628 isoform X2 [Maniola jurtina]